MVETVEYRPEELTPNGLKGFFAEVLADLDARPRRVTVKVAVPAGPAGEIDFGDGNPIFRVEGRNAAHADYRRRWLPDHAVPLALAAGRVTSFVFTPTDGNRLRVR